MPQRIPTLHRNRPFGTIHPPVNLASIEQDGCYFANDGTFLRYVDEDGEAAYDAAAERLRLENRLANITASRLDNAAQPGQGETVDPNLAEREIALREREAEMRDRELRVREAEIALAQKQTIGAAADIASGTATDQPVPVAKTGKLSNPGGPLPPADDKGGEEGAGASDKPKVKVDLRAWAMKEENYPFFQVKAAVQEQYPAIKVTNTQTITDGLVKQGVLTADEVKR